jgi:2-hydroxy-3-keto-5-methylthiopentenyl-1-phosphate phosphatase
VRRDRGGRGAILVAVDLSELAVFLDFDGTISLADTGVHLLESLGGPGWRDADARYDAGLIGSRECLTEQWAALPTTDEATLRAVAREVPLDPAFVPLVDGLRAAGATVTVVSDGFGFHVHEACAPLGLTVLTNAVDFTTGTLTFPHEDRCCPCTTCGTCKQAPVRDAQREGRTAVFVGDGTSDRKAALLADLVWAKGALADWCAANGVAHTRFDVLEDVHWDLLGRGPA